MAGKGGSPPFFILCSTSPCWVGIKIRIRWDDGSLNQVLWTGEAIFSTQSGIETCLSSDDFKSPVNNQNDDFFVRNYSGSPQRTQGNTENQNRHFSRRKRARNGAPG